MIRPDWRTIRRRSWNHPTDALAAEHGTCSHGHEVAANEPIVASGAVTVQEPDGRKHVDVSGVEWHPAGCGGAA